MTYDNMNEPPGTITDAEVTQPALPLAKREPEAPTPDKTPAQAKNDAIAALTLSAYSRASELKLTADEIAALSADFPDEAFKPGAGGKEQLLYVEHAFLRDRLNKVFGMGQWAIVPRNRWAETFMTKAYPGKPAQEASRAYVEAMLLVRGCFVAEAVGEMEYYPSNAAQNYGDAVEGAKTAAFRRCCKEFGIGLQAWKKDWGDGWWQRKRGSPTQPPPPQPTRPAPAPAAKPAATPAAAKSADVLPPKKATAETLKWWLSQIESLKAEAWEWATKNGILLETESLQDWPLDKVPTNRAAAAELLKKINTFAAGGEPPSQEEAWKEFPVPYGKNAGRKLGDLETSTIFGYWANHKVETEYNGRPISADRIASAKAFREALDQAGIKYKFDEPNQTGDEGPDQLDDFRKD